MVARDSTIRTRATVAIVRRLKRSKAGAAATEFALILPLLLLILAGGLQFGVLMMTYNSMVNGARSAARALSLGDTSEAEVRTAVRNWMPAWVPDSAVTVTATAVGADRVRVDVSVPTVNATVLRLVPMSETLDVSIVMMREN